MNQFTIANWTMIWLCFLVPKLQRMCRGQLLAMRALNGIDKKMSLIESFNTYTHYDSSHIPRGVGPIGSRLVLHVKLDSSGGDSHRLKACFCAKGFIQDLVSNTPTDSLLRDMVNLFVGSCPLLRLKVKLLDFANLFTA